MSAPRQRQRRRQSWNRSQSDSGFRPIKQVGYATSVGFPLMVVGAFMFPIAYYVGGTLLWVLSIGFVVSGLLVASSGRLG